MLAVKPDEAMVTDTNGSHADEARNENGDSNGNGYGYGQNGNGTVAHDTEIEADENEHHSSDINVPLASADDLMSVFHKRLNTVVTLDHLANTSMNDLKLYNDEFQFLSTTNGVYLEQRIVESLKNELSADPIIHEKIFKRYKKIMDGPDVTGHTIQTLLDYLVDTQTEREYVLQALQHPNLKKKLSEIDDGYIAPLQVDYIDPLKNVTLNNDLNHDPATENGDATKKKSGRGGNRRGGRVAAAKKAPAKRDAAQKSTTSIPARGGAKKSKKMSLETTAIANNLVLGKRKRKPISRDDEMLGDEEIDQLLQEEEEAAAAAAAASTAASASENAEPLKKKRKRPTAGAASASAKGAKAEDTADGKGPADASSVTDTNVPAVPVEPALKYSQKELKTIERLYDNTYLSIWKDMARKDSPKAYRLFQQTSQAKSINLRKTAQLAARESKKWQVRTTKAQKDQLAKSRRCMREMLSFWKKNEKEERNLRQKAEQEALQKAKREEEEREAKRQARKLNFLINQTELYSHFIGKKIKTSELEGDMGDKSHPTSEKSNVQHREEDIDLSMATKDFRNLAFEEEDEEELNKMAAANAQTALLEAKHKAQQFNEGVQRARYDDDDEDDEENEGEMNFQNPTSIGDITVEQPKLLNCTLKEYQRKGLNWLVNLYEQGINGILADEMGLGKTVQSISVLAYLAETHNIWGPFLVVTPASTLHNWQQEITKFVPDFNVLPYWGTAKDRKVLRKFWDRKNVIYNRNSPFHVVVTSYQLVVADQQYFQKMKWQYMILDEAQAIKSSQSSRWKSLLNLQCRNRLLLTGTPIQNNMQELWALLHFIMPSLFDSHDEFSEWFSKDIEAHAQSNSKLNEEQLRRLHAILKPFMLRRIKKNVQSELGEKIEIDVYCDLTNRQKKQYRMLRSQINLVDLIENNKRIGNSEEVESLMNVVMQFRKVCNHPDLFERADTRSAFSFGVFPGTESLIREVNEPLLELSYNTKNLIEYHLPRPILNDLLLPSFENNNLTDKERLIEKMFNVYDANNYIHDSKSELSILKLVDESPGEIDKIVANNLIMNAIDMRSYVESTDEEKSRIYREIYQTDKKNSLILNDEKRITIPEVFKSVSDEVSKDMYMRSFPRGYFETALAPPIEVVCSTSNFENKKMEVLYKAEIRQALLPLSLDTQAELLEHEVPVKDWPKAEMLPVEESNYMDASTIRLPAMERFVLESAKLKKLDQMLVDLKRGDHKCLIYFQMTRMMDLMEEYLSYRQYKYIRLDGSSKLSDRRDLVNDWQTNPELFIFLLSTRAGGLGINLTAADTVIFYDSDWNPTIDSQAMDRAHRLGQQRQVTVYRLLVRGTIEERMRDRAKQKEHVQQVVMEGKVDEIPDEKDEKEKEKKEMALWLLEDDK
jgi:chromatin-remodeling ATPase INO80